ncbi:hypothetical protein Vadar_000609 [Vaccinium darrowii]|uniref:Uncharacterized protein n=1 Tax=Vaccinium darrowii TaxID=229202 RepID=A0ACB7YT27_9ERIC|nr:hypothetical protein Vadar_000609 [Vaccinium darrowii]
MSSTHIIPHSAEFCNAMNNFDQDLLAMNISSGADYVCPVGDEDEITYALPSPNRFGEGEASSIDPLSLEKENATDSGGIQVEGSCRHFSLDELLIATKDFDDALVIGTGGFVFCGRPPVDTRLEEEKISLILWAKMCIKKGQHSRIVDPSLNGEIRTKHSLKYFAKLANKCLHFQPKERPTMAEVVKSLEIVLVAQDRQGRRSGIKRMAGFCFGQYGWAEDYYFPDIVIQQKYPRFSLTEIYAATNNFSHGLLINQDSRFRLYKGHMVGGTLEVAIKWYMTSIDEVKAEIQVQSLSGHRNIVALIGVSVEMEMDEIMLVYEYMINGTLHSHLHETGKDPLLWNRRLKICIDIAQGLEYLHTNVELQVTHCNIKPSHIFLDDQWVAKVADFELSRLIIKETKFLKTPLHSRVVDDYEIYGQDPKTSDVYAFGVLLLEVLFAKEAYTRLPYMGEDPLLLWLKGSIKRGTIDEVIDPNLIGKIAPNCLRYYVNIALSCLFKEGIRRPSMGDVLGSLQSTLQLQEAWEKSIETSGELPMAGIPGSYNGVISVDSEFTIGEQSFLVSDLVQPWSYETSSSSE